MVLYQSKIGAPAKPPPMNCKAEASTAGLLGVTSDTLDSVL